MTRLDNLDILLEYLSEIGGGTWGRFRDALAACRVAPGAPPVWSLQNLAALGHLEFDQDTLDWAVCPPAVVELPNADRPGAILCGARSPGFLARACAVAEGLGGRLDDPPPWEGDIVLRIRFWLPSRDAVRAFAEQLDVVYLPDAARTLARHLPSIDSLILACSPEEAPQAETLDVHDPRPWWRRVGKADGPGLYRLQSIPYDRFWLHTRSGAWRVSYPVGLYGCRRDLLRYSAARSAITFDARARPPALHLRTLVLCSGSLPRPAIAGRLEVLEVPRDVALAVAASLRQEGIG